MFKRSPSSSDRPSFGRSDVIFFGLVFLFLYTQLFQLPLTPYYFGGDHLIPISNAMRLLDGEVMYRDFFHITPPGAELWYAAFFSVFGIKVWVLNFTILLLNLGLVSLAWYFSRQLFTGLLVYAAPTLLIIFGFRLFFIDGSYRLFCVIFALAAAAVLMRSRGKYEIVLAGILCGISTLFGHPRGVTAIAGIALFLTWAHFRHPSRGRGLFKTALLLGVPFAFTVFATQIYFAITAGFDNYYFSLVTFLQKYYASDPLSNQDVFLADLPDLGQFFSIYSPAAAVSRYVRLAAPTLFFYAVVPWPYFAFLLYRWRRKTYLENAAADQRLILLCSIGIALTVGISAPSGFRLSHISIPAIVVLVWFLSRMKLAPYITVIVLCVSGILGAAYAIQRQTIEKSYLDMPAGRAAFLSPFVFERYKWVGEHTRPGDLFYEGHHPTFYFPFHLKNPTPLYVVRDNNYSPPFQVDSVLRSLQAHPPEYILWPRKWSKAADKREPGDNLEDLWQFVQGNYEIIFVFEKPLDYTPNSEGDIEVWRKKDK